MKKTLLSFILLGLIGSLNAQYVIKQENAPKPGDVNEVVIDTMAQVSKGSSGANRTWDFTDFDFDEDGMMEWSDAAQSPDIDFFTEADLFVDGDFAVYFDVTPTKMEWIGIATSFGGTERSRTRLSNTETAMLFPTTYNTTYKDSSAYQLSFPLAFEIDENTSIDSGRSTYKNYKDVMFDAWGTMTTPLAVFPNSLRERAYTITEQKFEVYICVVVVPGLPRQCSWVDAGTLDPQFAGGIDTTVVYNWYNSALTSPVAGIVYNGNESEVMEATFNNDPTYTGISATKMASGLVYPNPANDFFYLKGITNPETVTITDITGKIVKTTNLSGKNSVAISDLPAGNYTVSIISSKGVSTDKLVVIR